MAHLDLETHVVGPGAPVDGKTIGQMRMRREHHVTVVGIRRGGEPLPDPDGDTRFEAGDVAVVLGAPEHLARAASLFRPPDPATRWEGDRT